MSVAQVDRRRGGMLATLARRDFGLLWLAGLISNLGSWTTIAALPVFVYQETGSAPATATVFTVSVAPLLFSSAAGVLVDRWDRRRALIASNLALAAVTTPLLMASGGRLWLMYACLLGQATGRLISSPAENALLPRLAGEHQLPAANALNALNDSLGRIIGPVIGACLLTWSGFGAVIVADVASFVAAAVLVGVIKPLARAPRPATPAERRPGWRSEWLAGLSMIKRSRLLTIVFAAAATALLGDAILSSLLAPFVATTLGAGAAGFGVFLTIRGIGGVIGSAVASRASRRLTPQQLIMGATFGLGLVVAVLVTFPHAPLGMIGAGVLGILVVVWLTNQQTLIQTTVDDSYLGRAYGTLGTITALTMIIGSILAGTLVGLVGISTLIYAAAACYLAATLVLLPLPRPKTEPISSSRV